MKRRFFPSVFGVLCAPLASAAYVQVWQIGIDNNDQAEFVQESSGLEPAPGSASARDDDYYLTGTVNAVAGAKVLEITRTGGLIGDDAAANSGWIQYDFLQLEV